MSVDWKAIQEGWLLGQTISLSETDVLDRFRLIEELLGETWLNALKATPGFAPPILRAMLIADKLLAVKDCVGVSAVLEKIALPASMWVGNRLFFRRPDQKRPLIG